MLVSCSLIPLEVSSFFAVFCSHFVSFLEADSRLVLFPPTQVNMTIQRVNSTTPETLNVPYQSFYLGEDFSDADS